MLLLANIIAWMLGELQHTEISGEVSKAETVPGEDRKYRKDRKDRKDLGMPCCVPVKHYAKLDRSRSYNIETHYFRRIPQLHAKEEITNAVQFPRTPALGLWKLTSLTSGIWHGLLTAHHSVWTILRLHLPNPYLLDTYVPFVTSATPFDSSSFTGCFLVLRSASATQRRRQMLLAQKSPLQSRTNTTGNNE